MLTVAILCVCTPEAYSQFTIIRNNDQVKNKVVKKKVVKKKQEYKKPAPQPSTPKPVRPTAPAYTSETLLRLNPGEYIFENEYESSWKARKRDFMMITHDPGAGRYYLVVNGKREITSTSPINVFYVNPDNITDMAVVYTNPYGQTQFYLNGTEYGPVSEIYNVWAGPSTFKAAVKINGQVKLLDTDGSSQTMRDYNNLGAGPLVFHSPNGKNFASFTNKGNTVVHNGKKIDLRTFTSTQTPTQALIRKITLTDDNQLMVEGDFGTGERGLFVNENGIKQTYNPSTHTPSFALDRIVNTDDDTDDDEDYHYGFQLNGSWGFDLSDNSGMHNFESSWTDDYVTIDGKQMGRACAVYAYYDDYRHAFVWICIEDNAVVMHTYKI